MEYEVFSLPLFNDPYYQYTVSLESETKLLTFYWTERGGGAWHMDIRMDDDTPVVLGIKLVTNYPMLDDLALEDYNINGFFLLSPISEEVNNLSLSRENISQYYRLYYFQPV